MEVDDFKGRNNTKKYKTRKCKKAKKLNILCKFKSKQHQSRISCGIPSFHRILSRHYAKAPTSSFVNITFLTPLAPSHTLNLSTSFTSFPHVNSIESQKSPPE